MPTLARPRVEYRTPEDLVGEVLRGQVRIPPFQRGFKWEAGDIVKLFDSLLRGFPVGNLLLWQRPAPAQHLQVGHLVIEAPRTDSALWVVDGQQRITSLVGALVAAESASDSRFRVHLDLDTGEFHTIGARQLPPGTWLPVSLLLDTRTLLGWMRDNATWLSDAQLSLADRAAKAIREYQIPTYVVSSPDEEPLVEIFARMNTTGKPLTKAEVFQALHSGTAGDEPTDLPDVGRVTAQQGFGSLDDRLVLRCVLAFRGGDIFREDFRQEFLSEDDRTDTFRQVAGALREVVAFLRGEGGIPHVRLLPYSHVLPVLVRFIRLHGVPSGRASVLLRRWVWRSAVAGTRARGASVVDIRNQVLALDVSDPVEAAKLLLKHVQPFPDFLVELDKVHFGHAMAKINVLGLLANEPREPLTGELVDVTRLLDTGSPLRAIVDNGQSPRVATVANRAVTSIRSRRELAQALAAASPDVAASQLVDEDAQQLLVEGRAEAFLERRAQAVARAIKTHVDRMAEWGARDGRAITDIIRSVA
jgi:hypothetical protein